ncbi:PPOX class F420-dependent oxidoreductase [Pseudonocardia sp. TRM90224]|uniref:PPOX class F420-dependent oxidoreductase n=1 Tax=Pseudonocardia sp. TRM90224 TaxID=2812678 RepID=UPI001E4FA34A|nr:PPOX class F420-dependent oxidoreductase [Pseudonocardia sp. TRM90224]
MAILTSEIRAFLSEGTRTGKVAYTAADGRALVAPVWFAFDGDDLIFNTGSRTAKGRAIARDPRLTLCVDIQEPPYAYVQVQCEVTTSEDLDELVRTATLIAARYMGEDRAEEFGKRNGAPGELVVRLHPVKVVTDLNVTG